MNEFRVHSVPGSPYGRAVLIALEEKRAPYRFVAVAPGTLRSPEHLARHPFGRVPVLEHGGFYLYETQAILRYLDRVLAEPALTPPDARNAARMDQLMNVNDWYLFLEASRVITFQRVVRPRLMGVPADEAAVAAALPLAQRAFDEIARALADRSFLVGDSMSLADVLIAPQLDFFRQTPEWQPLTEPHAALRAWMERLAARPSMAATTWERVAAMA